MCDTGVECLLECKLVHRCWRLFAATLSWRWCWSAAWCCRCRCQHPQITGCWCLQIASACRLCQGTTSRHSGN